MRQRIRTGMISGALFAVVCALFMPCSARAQPWINTDWLVTKSPFNALDTSGNTSSNSFTLTITSKNYAINISWIYDSSSENCTDSVSISFGTPGGVAVSNNTGICTMTNGIMYEEESHYTVTNCDPNVPISWSANCSMAPVCPNAGPAATYTCGSSVVCTCNTPLDSNGGALAICSTGGVATYGCGSEVTCACTPQGTLGATAPYCNTATGQVNTTASPCIPPASASNPSNALNFPQASTLQQDLLAISQANPTPTIAPQDLVNAVQALSNQTNGCANNNPPASP